ncbi:hypothetical protein PMAYCL1PPCAC_31775, partial [Pristionchus mayeri]
DALAKMNHDRPSTSAMPPPANSVAQDQIVFAFEREYFSNFGQTEPQSEKTRVPKLNPFQNGLQLRDQELVDFLNERLGDHDETWAGKNVAAFLSREMIEELETCFQGLEPIAKLKVVLGFSQLSTKRLQDWSNEINTLLEIAAQDPDDWVEAISDSLRIFSPTGIIQLEPTRNLEMYRDALARIYSKLLEFANRDDSEFNNVPTVYHFCDEKVIQTELNYTPRQHEVHFTLKKKLKGDLLREEVLNELKQPKPTEDKSGLVSSLPMKFRSTLRKPDLKTPMRGIVQPNAMKINGGFTSEPKKFPRQLSKRDGGALLISIDDIPHAHQKRKKDFDKEERERKKEQAEAEKKRVEAEKKKAILEKAGQKRKEVEKIREDAMKRKHDMENRLSHPASTLKPEPRTQSDQSLAFSDPSLELEKLRHQRPGTSKMEEKEEGEIPMDTMESEKAIEWMYHHDEASQSKIGDNQEDDYEFLNRPRPAGLESRETIIQKTTSELIDSITCCTLEQQRQIVAFMSGNKSTYRPMLGSTNIFKISDSTQQGIVNDAVCRVRVESFIHMDFDSGEWKKQQRCKVLVDNETPRDYDGRHCPRLTHQQIFNEIARNLCDEPEDKKFAGESVIVHAYVPKDSEQEMDKLLSPNSGNVSSGQEVTAGEMVTVQTGISGCICMRTVAVVVKSGLVSPVLVTAASAAAAAPTAPATVGAVLKQAMARAPPKKHVKTVPRPVKQEPPEQQQPMQQQSQPVQAAVLQMTPSQLQQVQQQFGVPMQGQFVLQQGLQLQTDQQQRMVVVQQQQHHQQQQQRMLLVQQPQQQQLLMQQQPMLNGQQLQQIALPQFMQHSVISGPTNPQNNSAFIGNQQFPNGTQMIVVNGNFSNFNIVPQPQMPNVSMQQSYSLPQNQLQNNVSYQFHGLPNQNQQQQYRY